MLKRRGLSRPHPDHPVYPCLLKGVEVTQLNQFSSAEIAYGPVREGSAYLVAILDWYSRKVLAWELSNIFIERLWRRAEYDEISLNDYVSLIDAHAQLDTYFLFQVNLPGQSIGRAEVFPLVALTGSLLENRAIAGNRV